MSFDTEIAIFSTTKALASVALLQLVEQGQLDLDAPASNYVDALARVKVLEGFAQDGSPLLREPRNVVTTRMLMLHTAGFGYDNFNDNYRRLIEGGYLTSVGDGTRKSLDAPLLFDPGEKWEYGLNVDWVGQILESVTGQRLAALLTERVFNPLDMSSTAFFLTPEEAARRATIHTRLDDGSLAPLDYVLPQDSEIDMAGHGLYSTAGDYAKFLRMWLNDGAGPNGRVLSAETVEAASRNGLGVLKVRPLPGVNTFMTRDVEMFPGTSKSWSLIGMVNDESTFTGRPAGTLSWIGIANSYFWLDRKNDLGGFWSTQVLPLGDPASLDAYYAFETEVYRAHGARA
jgi:methyl acetate hydrolase